MSDDVKIMLERRARDVTPDPNAWERIAERIEHGDEVRLAPVTSIHHRRWPLLAAAAVVVAIAAIAVGLAVQDDDAGVDTTVPPASDGPAAPGWFDPASAGPVFQSGRSLADAGDAARTYLDDRDLASATTDGSVEESEGITRALWGGDTAGVVYMRLVDGCCEGDDWEVVGSFTDGVELDQPISGVDYVQLTGTVTSDLPARIVTRDSTGRVLARQDLEGRSFDVKTQTTESLIMSVELLDSDSVVGITEVRLDPSGARPIYTPTDPSIPDEPGAVTKAFVSDVLGVSQVDHEVTIDGADAEVVVTLADKPPLVVSLRRADDEWHVTTANSIDHVAWEVDGDTQPQPTLRITVESPGDRVTSFLRTLDGRVVAEGTPGGLITGQADSSVMLPETTPLILFVNVDDNRWFLTRIG